MALLLWSFLKHHNNPQSGGGGGAIKVWIFYLLLEVLLFIFPFDCSDDLDIERVNG